MIAFRIGCTGLFGFGQSASATDQFRNFNKSGTQTTANADVKKSSRATLPGCSFSLMERFETASVGE
jgi:cell division septal protein FtsQ